MLLTGGGKVKDVELHRLREFLIFIDTKLSEIDQRITNSVDPESDGLLDQGEYLIGIGFVVIQQHLTDSLIGLNISKNESFALGSVHQSGPTSISVINSAANWWKHEAEWFKNGNVPKNGERTFETIMGISKQNEYALSNVLASFSETKTISFIECIVPHIEQWTRELVSHNETKKA